MTINDYLKPLEAMPQILERLPGPVMLDYIPVQLKKELHNDAGAVFVPGIYLVNPENGEVYTEEDGHTIGYAFTDGGQIIGFEWSTGRPVTIRDFMTLAVNDAALLPFIDLALYNEYADELAGQVSFDELTAPSAEPAPIKLTTTKASAYTIGKDKLNALITTMHAGEELELKTLKGGIVGITAKAWRRHGAAEELDIAKDGTLNTSQSVIKPSMLPILNALNSIWNQAQATHTAPAFTLASLYNQIYGTDATTQKKPETLEALRRALEDMSDIYLKVDATKEITARYKHDPDAARDILRDIWEGQLIAIDKRRIEVRGEVGEGYIMLRRPLNYQAAQITKQVITIPAREIRTPLLNNSLDTASLRDYLFSQLDYMASDRRRSNRISYATIYDYMNITPENYKNVKDKRAKTRAQVKKLLEHMKNNGRIIAYTEYTKANRLEGVEVQIAPHN